MPTERLVGLQVVCMLPDRCCARCDSLILRLMAGQQWPGKVCPVPCSQLRLLHIVFIAPFLAGALE